jgi:hypothetical protein
VGAKKLPPQFSIDWTDRHILDVDHSSAQKETGHDSPAWEIPASDYASFSLFAFGRARSRRRPKCEGAASKCASELYSSEIVEHAAAVLGDEHAENSNCRCGDRLLRDDVERFSAASGSTSVELPRFGGLS